MTKFIHLREDYVLSKTTLKKIENEINHCEGLKGKIIETELDPVVYFKDLEGIKLESSIALHTLRLNIGKRDENGTDLVLHMAKESLKAFELSPNYSPNSKEPNEGIVAAFRKDIRIEYAPDAKYERHELNLSALEKGISAEALGSVGKIMSKVGFIGCVFPSWYYEDWVQIQFTNKRNLLIRIDPECLYGVGFGKINNSTLHHNYKEDTIFYWNSYADDIMRRYYADQGYGGDSYENLTEARIKVKVKEDD